MLNLTKAPWRRTTIAFDPKTFLANCDSRETREVLELVATRPGLTSGEISLALGPSALQRAKTLANNGRIARVITREGARHYPRNRVPTTLEIQAARSVNA